MERSNGIPMEIFRLSTIVGCFFYGFVVPGAPEGSTGRLIFVVVLGEARDRTCDPWFTRRVT